MKTISFGFFILRVDPASFRRLTISLAMLIAAGLAIVLTPSAKVSSSGYYVDLELMIPKRFGDWRVDERIMPIQANPEVQAAVNKIYNQVLSRTYINGRGERIMLSIAYGGDQRDSMQVHKPEICYPAQGFIVTDQSDSVIDTGFNQLPVSRLVAVMNRRTEPITYWIILGEKVPATGLARKFEQLKYGLTGRVPDGLLFRVSNIQRDSGPAYATHTRFITELLKNMKPEDRVRLIGKPT